MSRLRSHQPAVGPRFVWRVFWRRAREGAPATSDLAGKAFVSAREVDSRACDFSQEGEGGCDECGRHDPSDHAVPQWSICWSCGLCGMCGHDPECDEAPLLPVLVPRA